MSKSKTFRMNYEVYSFVFGQSFAFVAYCDADSPEEARKSINPLAENVSVTLVEERK